MATGDIREGTGRAGCFGCSGWPASPICLFASLIGETAMLAGHGNDDVPTSP